MKCTDCQQENEYINRFCIYCGSPLPKSRTWIVGLIITAIPIVALSLIGMAVIIYAGEWTSQLGGFLIWVFACGLWLIGLLITIYQTFRGTKLLATGMWTGIGIGLISIAISGFLWEPYS